MHGLHMVHGDLKGVGFFNLLSVQVFTVENQANILINQHHRACLVDFGLSTTVGAGHTNGANVSFVTVGSRTSLMSFTAGGTPRWMSPELIDPEQFGASDDRPTKKSDCYALGMVVYEVCLDVTILGLRVIGLMICQVLLGKPPYWEITNEGLLIYAIMEGYRPKKPNTAESLGFTNELWKILQQSWLPDTSARPDVRIILSHLNHATWSWERRWSV